jgi:hypothetical protein
MKETFETDIGTRFTVEEIFKYKEKTCFVVLVQHSAGALNSIAGIVSGAWTMMEGGRPLDILKPHHNGYVQTKNNAPITILDYSNEFQTVDVNFSGKLFYTDKIKQLRDKWFLGFDTGHGYNTEADKTFKATKEATLKLAEEMEELGI